MKALLSLFSSLFTAKPLPQWSNPIFGRTGKYSKGRIMKMKNPKNIGIENKEKCTR